MSRMPSPRLFFHDGAFGPGYLVKLRVRRLFYCNCFPDQVIVDEEEVETTPERWNDFWEAVDRVGVWNWAPSYENADIRDGSWWTLKLRHGSRTVSSHGLNAYPGSEGPGYAPDCSYALFLAALGHLVGPRMNQYEPPE